MQEKVTTIKSEDEKMIPLDTSGNSVDVEIKEESSTPENEVEVKSDAVITEVTEEAPKEDNKEELEEYSATVKKRIDKLTKKMREAERREEAAIAYAKNVQSKQKELESTIRKKDDLWLEQNQKTIESQEEFAKRALQAAIQEGDTEKQVEAQQAIAKLTIDKERLQYAKMQSEEDAGKTEHKLEDTPPTPPKRQISEKARSWADKNEWFNNDRAMTFTAMEIHRDLVQEGFDVESDNYYTEINTRIRKDFPHKFSDGGDTSKPKQKVASAVRTSSTGRRTVRLTPSQVAISKKLGVPLEEYAKHVKEA